jgi:hypothetical protein
MPATASERSVRDPFDPFEALPKSAEFLRELNAQFGILASRQQPTMLAATRPRLARWKENITA